MIGHMYEYTIYISVICLSIYLYICMYVCICIYVSAYMYLHISMYLHKYIDISYLDSNIPSEIFDSSHGAMSVLLYYFFLNFSCASQSNWLSLCLSSSQYSSYFIRMVESVFVKFCRNLLGIAWVAIKAKKVYCKIKFVALPTGEILGNL